MFNEKEIQDKLNSLAMEALEEMYQDGIDKSFNHDEEIKIYETEGLRRNLKAQISSIKSLMSAARERGDESAVKEYESHLENLRSKRNSVKEDTLYTFENGEIVEFVDELSEGVDDYNEKMNSDVEKIRQNNPKATVHNVGTKVTHKPTSLGGHPMSGKVGVVNRVEDHGAGMIAHFVRWPKKRKDTMHWGSWLQPVEHEEFEDINEAKTDDEAHKVVSNRIGHLGKLEKVRKYRDGGKTYHAFKLHTDDGIETHVAVNSGKNGWVVNKTHTQPLQEELKVGQTVKISNNHPNKEWRNKTATIHKVVVPNEHYQVDISGSSGKNFEVVSKHHIQESLDEEFKAGDKVTVHPQSYPTMKWHGVVKGVSTKGKKYGSQHYRVEYETDSMFGGKTKSTDTFHVKELKKHVDESEKTLWDEKKDKWLEKFTKDQKEKKKDKEVNENKLEQRVNYFDSMKKLPKHLQSGDDGSFEGHIHFKPHNNKQEFSDNILKSKISDAVHTYSDGSFSVHAKNRAKYEKIIRTAHKHGLELNEDEQLDEAARHYVYKHWPDLHQFVQVGKKGGYASREEAEKHAEKFNSNKDEHEIPHHYKAMSIGVVKEQEDLFKDTKEVKFHVPDWYDNKKHDKLFTDLHFHGVAKKLHVNRRDSVGHFLTTSDKHDKAREVLTSHRLKLIEDEQQLDEESDLKVDMIDHIRDKMMKRNTDHVPELHTSYKEGDVHHRVYTVQHNGVKEKWLVKGKKENGKNVVTSQQMNEEQLDEISKKTLGRYVKKAAAEVSSHSYDSAKEMHNALNNSESHQARKFYLDKSDFHADKSGKRQKGIHKAVDKLTKESEENIPNEII